MKKICLLLILPSLAIAAPSSDNIEVGFSPNGTSLELILKAINSAKTSICVAAYSFTSKPVSEAILKAKNKGVKIKLVADEESNKKAYSAVTFLANQGVDVHLNGHYKILHDKFMVIDNQTVQTGSFNYSASAANKNAENVIIIWNNKKVASQYAKECDFLYDQGYKLEKAY